MARWDMPASRSSIIRGSDSDDWSGDGLCGSFHKPKEPITVTPAEIIYQRRIAVLDHAQRTGNVTEACAVFGISRTRYYEWKNVADRYGLEALMPKWRRNPQLPEATPTHVVEALLTLAVLQPTIGCRQYADRLGDQGFSIAKSTVQKHLVSHGLGKRAQRLAKAAAIAAATIGLVVPDAERKDEPFGFCLASGGPGELVCLDSFYIDKLKGAGKVYQLTAIDVFTRFRGHRHRARHTQRWRDGPLHRPGPAPLSPSRGEGPGNLDGQRGRICSRRLRRRPGRLRGCGTTASRPDPPTTMPSANGSKAPCSKSAGARPFIVVTSPRSASSRPKQTPGSSPTTIAGATTATTCGDVPSRDPRQSPEKQDSMTTINHSAHLSPPLAVRKV